MYFALICLFANQLSYKMKNIIYLLHFLLIFFFVGGHQLRAQGHLEVQLEKLFKEHYEQSETGAVLLISKNEEVIFERYHGYANLEHRIKVNENTKFLIGSITKQFTAAAILILEEQGLLSTKDQVHKYLPQFKEIKYPLTIHHLLTHTSGIPSDNASKDIHQRMGTYLSPTERIEMIREEPLLFNPGERFDYSNNAYIILGLVIERVSGKTYSDFLEEYIFEPLKMDDSQVLKDQQLISNRASGYILNDEGNIENAPVFYSFSAGGILSTPNDLKKWATALFSHKIISENSLAKMLHNYSLKNGDNLNLGYGWEINKIGDYISYEHSGAEPGYKCYSIFVPEHNIYVISCLNTEDISPTECSIRAAAIAAKTPYPNHLQATSLSKKQATNFVGTYLFGEDKERIIGLTNNELYFMAPGGIKQTLYAINDTTLVFENGYRQITFNELTTLGYNEIHYSNRIYHSKGTKISNQIPTENTAISISPEILQSYTGIYESEMFTMTIFLENESLFAQPQGSDKLKLIPKANNKFFIKEIGAEIEFISNEEGLVKQINILLEGQLMSGVKK